MNSVCCIIILTKIISKDLLCRSFANKKRRILPLSIRQQDSVDRQDRLTINKVKSLTNKLRASNDQSREKRMLSFCV